MAPSEQPSRCRAAAELQRAAEHGHVAQCAGWPALVCHVIEKQTNHQIKFPDVAEGCCIFSEKKGEKCAEKWSRRKVRQLQPERGRDFFDFYMYVASKIP